MRPRCSSLRTPTTARRSTRLSGESRQGPRTRGERQPPRSKTRAWRFLARGPGRRVCLPPFQVAGERYRGARALTGRDDYLLAGRVGHIARGVDARRARGASIVDDDLALRVNLHEAAGELGDRDGAGFNEHARDGN